jgi:hypothetical protein
MIQQAVQQAMAANSGSGAMTGGGGGGGLKPKIDVNVALMQILKILARLADALGVQIPAAEMVATSDDLNQMAASQQAPAGGGGGALGAIQPVSPMKAAQVNDWEYGEVFSGISHAQQAQQSTALKAMAVLRQR